MLYDVFDSKKALRVQGLLKFYFAKRSI